MNTKVSTVSCWGGKIRKSETRGRNKMTEIEILDGWVWPYNLVRHMDQYNGEEYSGSEIT